LFTSNEESYVYEENGLIINSPKLYQNYPNPFNPITIISFSLTTDILENTELIIYNIKGQKIKKLEIRNLKLGINNVVWNGTDNNDRPVSSGVYFYKLVAGNKTIATRKCLLLK